MIAFLYYFMSISCLFGCCKLLTEGVKYCFNKVVSRPDMLVIKDCVY